MVESLRMAADAGRYAAEENAHAFKTPIAVIRHALLPLSRVVFTQEGQFGPGFGAWLARTRPGAVMVMPRNLAGFFEQGLEDVPYFTMRGLDVVLPRGVSDATVTKFFHFFDDGDLGTQLDRCLERVHAGSATADDDQIVVHKTPQLPVASCQLHQFR